MFFPVLFIICHLYLAIDLDYAKLFLVTGGFQNDFIFSLILLAVAISVILLIYFFMITFIFYLIVHCHLLSLFIYCYFNITCPSLSHHGG